MKELIDINTIQDTRALERNMVRKAFVFKAAKAVQEKIYPTKVTDFSLYKNGTANDNHDYTPQPA